MSPRARWLLALPLACHAGPESAPVPESAAAAPVASTPVAEPPTGVRPPDPIDPTRRCGDPGREPTELPPALITGLTPHGQGVLRPNERRTHGTVLLEYDPDMQVAPPQVVHRRPVLAMTIDHDAVKGGGVYGQVELHPGRAFHLANGPYRLDARASADNQEVSYTLGRRTCPDSMLLAPTSGPLAMWLSTEGIRMYDHPTADSPLQLKIDAQGAAPRLDLAAVGLGYGHHFEPRPGEVRSFAVGATRVTIDRVVPGPNTRFERGQWSADGDARVHARVRLDPLATATLAAPVPATTPCGEASTVRTALPARLGALPPAADDVTASPGESRKLGPWLVTLREQSLPRLAGERDPTTYPSLRIERDGARVDDISLASRGAPRLIRLGAELLRIELAPPSQVRVRRFPLACAESHDVPVARDPVYVWLSTVGHRNVRVGTADPSPVSLTMIADVANPSLSIASARAHYGPPLTRRVGLAFSLDDHEVEVVDVETGGDTRPDTHGWRTSAPAPAVHVQVRITPKPRP